MSTAKKNKEPLNLEQLKKEILKDGTNSIVSLTGKAESMPHISTGAFLLDVIMGIGGIPLGRVIEFYGFESSGKTTVASSCAAICQKVLQKPVLYLDYEHSLDKPYLMAQGVNISDDMFVYGVPNCMEDGFKIIGNYMINKAVGLVVVDSVAAMCPRAELEGDMGDVNSGGVALGARIMAVALRQLVPLANQTGIPVIFINQLREGIPMTNFERSRGIKKKNTPGGRALKFYASVRVEFTKIDTVDGKIFNAVKGVWEKGIVANKVKAFTSKNKCAPPFRSCEFVIRYGVGVDNIMSVVMIALERNILVKNGSYIKVPAKYRHDSTEKSINGLELTCKYFRFENIEKFSILENDLKTVIEDDLKLMKVNTYVTGDLEEDSDLSSELNDLLNNNPGNDNSNLLNL